MSPAAQDRHTIDQIARAVVSGRRGLGVERDRMADLVASLSRNRLEAVFAPGVRRARRRRPGSLASLDPMVRCVLDRTAKHLAGFAASEQGTRATPSTR